MSGERLRPARYEPEDIRAFRPRLPWRWIALAGAVGLLLGGAWFYREHRRREALRERIAQDYARSVQPVRQRLLRFRDRLERWVRQSASRPVQRSWADPRFRFEGLHGATGLYLRLSAKAVREVASKPNGLGAAIAGAVQPDAIARCLGLSVLSAAFLYRRGRYLEDAWLQEVASTSSMMRLRVLQKELQRFIQRELPMLLELSRADYFLLVLERGPNRRDGPVDAYLWSLRDGRSLLRARAKAQGLLVPVRLALPGGPRRQPRMPSVSGGAVDCSIAAQIKAAAGRPVPSVSSEAAARLSKGGVPRAARPDGGTPSSGAASAGPAARKPAATHDASPAPTPK